jgi:hypothetical protein
VARSKLIITPPSTYVVPLIFTGGKKIGGAADAIIYSTPFY